MSHPDHFFKYCTASTAKIVLATKKVRWNSPLNFNDPFDCYFSEELKFDVFQATQKQRQRFFDVVCQEDEPAFDRNNRYATWMQAVRRLAKGRSRKELEALLGSAFDSFRAGLECTGASVRDEWRKRMAEFRLFCVCESNDNLLLWSHYTNSHTGAVLQFECLKALDVALLEARPVIYSDETPAFATEDEWIEGGLGLCPLYAGEDFWIRLVTAKARVWEYEREWRVVINRRPSERQG